MQAGRYEIVGQSLCLETQRRIVHQGLTKAGPTRVRKHLFRMAWRWLHFQFASELALWYYERTKDGHGRNRRRMIVALARKLLVVLWKLTTRGKYPRKLSKLETFATKSFHCQLDAVVEEAGTSQPLGESMAFP